MSDIINLQAHRERLCNRADTIIGQALILRMRLKRGDNLPLPDKEADALIRALSDFIRAARDYER